MKPTGHMVTCKGCGKSIYRAAWQLKKGRTFLCSPSCKSTMKQYRCAACGKEVMKPRWQAARNMTGRFYCNKKCQHKGLSMFNTMQDNPLYKGKYLASSGYEMTLVAPKKYVATQRVEMEKRIGRKLRSSEIVHHKNGVKTDNDPGNLEVMSRAQHVRLHRPVDQTKRCKKLRL